jgi:two-component system NtrC family sensor kinase
MNLMNNALDAMEEKGGKLGIEISKSGRDMAKVRISDTGAGISADNLQKIYDPFFTTKPAGKGTGLGLSICYGIIRDLRGEITAQSVPGAGSVFEVILPLYKSWDK